MKAASATVMAINHGFTRGFQCACSASIEISGFDTGFPLSGTGGTAGSSSDKTFSSDFLRFGVVRISSVQTGTQFGESTAERNTRIDSLVGLQASRRNCLTSRQRSPHWQYWIAEAGEISWK